MPAKSNASPAKPQAFCRPGSLFFSGRQCGSAFTAGTPVQRRRDPAFVSAGDGLAAGAGSIVLLSGCVYGFGNLVSSPAAFDGDPYPLEPGVSGRLPFPYLSGACADAAVDGGALVPARAGGAMVSPRGFARTRPVFILVLLLRRWDGGPAVPILLNIRRYRPCVLSLRPITEKTGGTVPYPVRPGYCGGDRGRGGGIPDRTGRKPALRLKRMPGRQPPVGRPISRRWPMIPA